MTSSILVFNRFGEAMDSIEGVSTTPRSYVLNGYGRCEFSIPLDSQYCTERLLQFGNLIYVNHIRKIGLEEEGTTGKLPGWAGVILPPRNWSDKVVHVVAYSVEALLAYRAMPFVDVTGSPVSVMLQLVEYINRNNPPIRFDLETIADSPVTFQDRLRTNAYDHIRKLADFCGLNWAVHPFIVPDSNALQLFLNIFPKNTSPSGLVLNDLNSEASGDILTEQGTIFNRIYAYTQASTPQDRAFAVTEYQGSINTYGPFEINKVYTGITDPAILKDAADLKTASGSGHPQRVFKRVALDVDTVFDYLRVGNIVEIEEPRAGFNGSGGFGFKALVRILSMDYNDDTDKVNMNVEILAGTSAGLNSVIGIV